MFARLHKQPFVAQTARVSSNSEFCENNTLVHEFYFCTNMRCQQIVFVEPIEKEMEERERREREGKRERGEKGRERERARETQRERERERRER